VKAFAQRMITDHSGVNKSAVDLVTKLNVTPQDNPTSESLKSGGEKNVGEPQGLSALRSTRLTSIMKSPTISKCWTPSTRR
jgi:putative membrane protein